MKKVAVVTGGSSGIGLCCAQSLLQAGCTVYEISRRERDGGPVRHVSADVSDEAQAAAAVARILQETGRIDILVNNAGFGISGAVEFTELADAKRQLDVNFFGTVNMTRAVLPAMRQQGGGRIVNLSSVAGAIPIPFQTYYSASKAAIIAYTKALANEIRPFGITVCAVQPGDIRTGFTAARKKDHRGDEVYHGRISRSVSRMERDEENGMRPEAAGRFIADKALRRRVRPVYTIGFQYKLFVLIVKLLPASFVNYLVGLLYAK